MKYFLFSIILLCCSTSFLAQEKIQNDSLLLQIEQTENQFERLLLIINFVENTIGVLPEQTIAYQQKAIAYFSESIFPTKDFVATLLESLIERSQSKLDRALEKNLEVVEALENHQPSSHFSKMLLSKMLGYLGNIYIRSHYYEPGLDYLFTALAIAEEEEYVEGQSLALSVLAVLYSEGYDDNELAIEYTERALALSQQNDNQYGIMVLTDNLARYQTNLGNVDKALPLHLEAIRLAEVLNRKPFLGDFYNNIGGNYLERGQLENAINYANKAISVGDESRNGFLLAYSYHLLGKCMQQKKEWAASTTYFKKSLRIAKYSRDFKFVSELLNDFGESTTQINQPTKANVYFQEAISYKDTVYQALKIKQVLELETRHRIQEIEKEKALLQQEKTLQIQVISGQQKQLWLLGSLGFLAIVSSLIFFFQKIKLRDSYQTLVKKNRALISIEKKLPLEERSSTIDQDLKEKIKKELIENQLFLQPDLTVHKLAKQLDSNTTYVSKTINDGFGKNFSSLINEYRIKTALQNFEEGQYEKYTIESLGNQAGFKSRPAFINAFKKYTGVTPSFYIKQLKKQND